MSYQGIALIEVDVPIEVRCQCVVWGVKLVCCPSALALPRQLE